MTSSFFEDAIFYCGIRSVMLIARQKAGVVVQHLQYIDTYLCR